MPSGAGPAGPRPGDGYDLLVIGTRGHGATKALLGSTAVEVAESTKVPVLVMGAPLRIRLRRGPNRAPLSRPGGGPARRP